MRFFMSVCVFAVAALTVALLHPVAPQAGVDLPGRYSPTERLLHAAQFEQLRTRDPRTGAVPPGIRGQELAYAASLPQSEASGMRRTRQNPSAAWTSRGPTRVAGRMLDLAFDRDDEDILYAASASGGFWKSTDRGLSWRKTTAPDQEQFVGCLVQDPRPAHRDVLYCGTGELLSTTDRSIAPKSRTTGYGNGIYRSTDRGESWETLPSTRVSGSAGELISPFHGVWDLEISVEGWDAGAVYAACYGGILRSTDDGASWERVLGDAASPSFCTDIVLTPVISYAAIGGFTVAGTSTADRGVYVSTDRRSWTSITPDDFPDAARVVELAVPAMDPYVLYMITETPEPFSIPQFAFTASRHRLWKYTHDPTSGQGSWENRTAFLPRGGVGGYGSDGFNSLGGYCLCLAAHPQDPDLLYIGGTNLYRSDDAFTSTGSVVIIGGYPYDWELDQLHPDQHALAFLPSDPSQLYVANDGGVQVTTQSAGADPSWYTRNDGLVTAQVYRVAQDPVTPGDGFVIAGLQDNATFYNVDAGDPADWSGIIGGDGMTVAVAPDRSFGIASIYTGRLFSFLTLPGGGLYRLASQGHPRLVQTDFAFFTVFALDPVNGTTLYLGSTPTLWVKDDMRASAEDPSTATQGWREVRAAGFPSEQYISAIGCASDASGYVYIGSSGGGIKRVEDARGSAPRAVALSSPLFPQGGYVSCLAVSPDDGRRVFAVFSNYNVQSVFMSTDAGATWEAVSGNLEAEPDGSGPGPSVRWLSVLPLADGELYLAGTSAGLFSTARIDGMQTEWTRESADGIGAVCVDHIDARTVDGSVVVATQGAGVWAARFTSVNSAGEASAAADFVLAGPWPQPARHEIRITLTGRDGSAADVAVHDLRGRVLLRHRLSADPRGRTHTLDLGDLPEGLYLLTATQGSARRTARVLRM